MSLRRGGRTSGEAQLCYLQKGPHYCGEMAEWLKAHAWKACIPQGIQGSNPCLSAITLAKPSIIN